MFCSKCGRKVADGTKFCPSCGNPIASAAPAAQDYQQQNMEVNYGYRNAGYAPDGNTVLNTAIQKIESCAQIWLVIGIIQVVLGAIEICIGYGIAVVAVGIWNIVNSRTVKKNADYFRTHPREIVSFYNNQKTKTIVFLFINLFLGSIIGVVASVYEITMQSYFNENQQILNNL